MRALMTASRQALVSFFVAGVVVARAKLSRSFFPIRLLLRFLQLHEPMLVFGVCRLLFAFIRQIELTRDKTHSEARDLSAQERYSNICRQAMTCHASYIQSGGGIIQVKSARDCYLTIIHQLWAPIMFMMVPPIKPDPLHVQVVEAKVGGGDTTPVRHRGAVRRGLAAG